MTLSDYYAYYDDIVSDWLEETLIPYEPFMPEPWCGWTPDSGHQLHAVDINLNPGKGGFDYDEAATYKIDGVEAALYRVKSGGNADKLLCDTSFMCIWNSKRRNNIPANQLLHQIDNPIFEQILKHQQINQTTCVKFHTK